MKAEIITIGDEILIGQVLDTNSAFLGKELNRAGIEVVQITSVHDTRTHIVEALNAALQRADIALLTGGIGPTNDDITKQTLCEYFNTKLVFNESVYSNIERLLAHRPAAINPLTRAQASVPENAVIIRNEMGTAPIMWFERNGKVAVSMPGVPYEMENAAVKDVIPRLKERFSLAQIIHKTLVVNGIPESALAIKIADWENALPANIRLAYLPAFGIVRLRLSAVGDDFLPLNSAVEQQVETLKSILGDAVIAEDDAETERIVGKYLLDNDLTVATAESCTGGNIAHLLTSVAGSSAYFKGAVVAYANDVKINVLGVSAKDLEQYGAVSIQVAEQMAQNVRKLLNADIGVATTGIAGPDGGTAAKPAGTVWIALATEKQTISQKYQFYYKRKQNIERASQTALMMLLSSLRGTKQSHDKQGIASLVPRSQ
ncbi:MAG: competence/damage-inducible protein A [Paludibacter sp.]|nr:competence/damage-inducible protein A [Paludibacter sp.]